jgi:hypothetical protein
VSRVKHWLIPICLISVLLRIGIALYLGDVAAAPSLLVDQVSYHTLASRLLAGHGMSFGTGWYPFTPPDAPTAHWSFLQTLYLAAVYAVAGVHPLAARLATAIIGGSLLPLLTYRLCHRLFTDRTRIALIAAAGSAGYAFFALYSATLMSETLFMLALLWSLERTMALAKEPSARGAIVLGISLGLATLLRQSILPWVPISFAWLLWSNRERARTMALRAGLAGVVMVLMILPFTVRNWFAYDQFLLLNSNAGYAMYSAQHPMHGTSFQEHVAAPLPEEMREASLNEAEWDGELMRRGVGFVLADPIRYARLSLSRLLDFFEFWPTDTTLLNNLGRLGSYTLFLPFFAYGIFSALRGLRRPVEGSTWQEAISSPLTLTFAFMLVYTAQHILTWAMPRYRLPVDAVTMPFAALAIDSLATGLIPGWPIETADRAETT